MVDKIVLLPAMNRIFWATVIISFSPLKELSYFFPLLFVLIYIFLVRSFFLTFKSLLLFWFVVFYIFLWFLASNSFSSYSAFLSLLTYSSIFVSILLSPSHLSGLDNNKNIGYMYGFVVFQVIVALIQLIYGLSKFGGFDGSTGDFVEGTIHLPLESSLSFSNPMFAVLMSVFLLYLLPFVGNSGYRKVVLLFMVVVIFFSSVMHVTIFLFMAVLCSYVVVYRGSAVFSLNSFYLLLFFVILWIAFISYMPKNFANIAGSWEVLAEFNSPKLVSWMMVFDDLENPLGYGPGQLSSKAAFMSSGLMHDGKIEFFNEQNMSRPFKEIMLPLWDLVNSIYDSPGSSQSPFSSWLAAFSEFGVLFLLCIFLLTLSTFSLVKKITCHKAFILRPYLFSFLSMLLFLFFIGFQDLYWETPQVMLISILLCKMQQSRCLSEA